MPRGLHRGTVASRTAAASTTVKWRGGNVTIKPTHTSWKDFWGANYDFSWITAQIDKARTLGCNAIRIIGAVNGIVDSSYSRATYQARNLDVYNYLVGKGMAYYLVGCGDYATTLTTATKDELVALGGFFAGGGSNIVGYDILQEYDIYASQNSLNRTVDVLPTLQTWYTAVKAAAPLLSLTFSVSNNLATTTYGPEIASAADHYDWHFYVDTVPSQLPSDKRFIVGEVGANQSQSSGARSTRYQIGSNWNALPKSSGAFAWALADQSATSSDQWGIFDSNGLERTEMTAFVKGWPKTR